MNQRAAVVRLIQVYCAASARSAARVSTLIWNHGGRYKRVVAGADLTSRSYERAAQWLSDHWPADAEWPPDIPRPAPVAPLEPPAVPVPPREATAAARERKLAAVDAGDWEAAERHEHAMLKAALALDGRGQIADPGALCLALGVPRYIYDDVVRRYAGHPERRPRPTTRTARMVRSLRLSGDRRFAAAPRPREAA